jgi:hypothetical protein
MQVRQPLARLLNSALFADAAMGHGFRREADLTDSERASPSAGAGGRGSPGPPSLSRPAGSPRRRSSATRPGTCGRRAYSRNRPADPSGGDRSNPVARPTHPATSPPSTVHQQCGQQPVDNPSDKLTRLLNSALFAESIYKPSDWKRDGHDRCRARRVGR